MYYCSECNEKFDTLSLLSDHYKCSGCNIKLAPIRTVRKSVAAKTSSLSTFDNHRINTPMITQLANPIPVTGHLLSVNLDKNTHPQYESRSYHGLATSNIFNTSSLQRHYWKNSKQELHNNTIIATPQISQYPPLTSNFSTLLPPLPPKNAYKSNDISDDNYVHNLESSNDTSNQVSKQKPDSILLGISSATDNSFIPATLVTPMSVLPDIRYLEATNNISPLISARSYDSSHEISSFNDDLKVDNLSLRSKYHIERYILLERANTCICILCAIRNIPYNTIGAHIKSKYHLQHYEMAKHNGVTQKELLDKYSEEMTSCNLSRIKLLPSP